MIPVRCAIPPRVPSTTDPSEEHRAIPMRVVHIARRFAPMLGGIERYVRDLTAAQVRDGHQVTVVTLERDVIGDVPGRLPATEIVDGVRVVRVPGVGNRRFAICLRPNVLFSEIRRAQVVHHHDLRFMTGLVAMTSAMVRRPLLVHTHGLLFHTPWAATVKALAVRTYYGPLLRIGADRVIASSDPDAELLEHYAPYLAARTVTFDNATVLGPLLAVESRPEPGLIVTQGRIARHKGLDDLIRAVAEVKSTEWRLEIGGTEDRDERERLSAIVRQTGIGDRVGFTGTYTDEDHLAQLGRASLAVFPSHHEGFGLALLEAMGAGTPLLARDIPAHRFVLGPDLQDRLIRIDRPRDLAVAITRELGMTPGQRVALAERLRRRAADFDIGRLVDQIDGLYTQLRAPGAPAPGG